ncbi:hypothetical protein BDQ17DRAFT_1427268 [Cyathus striatus]|nr:hypothetical protein BDQ17DRAFT_1427268 [Cyathus striatus]
MDTPPTHRIHRHICHPFITTEEDQKIILDDPTDIVTPAFSCNLAQVTNYINYDQCLHKHKPSNGPGGYAEFIDIFNKGIPGEDRFAEYDSLLDCYCIPSGHVEPDFFFHICTPSNQPISSAHLTPGASLMDKMTLLLSDKHPGYKPKNLKKTQSPHAHPPTNPIPPRHTGPVFNFHPITSSSTLTGTRSLHALIPVTLSNINTPTSAPAPSSSTLASITTIPTKLSTSTTLDEYLLTADYKMASAQDKL